MTHTAKHTPGPWVVVSTFNGTRFVETQEGHSVCVLADTNDAANAHLIAAAPAMYEALQATLAYFMRSNQSHAPEVQAIRSALAQAEGRQA